MTKPELTKTDALEILTEIFRSLTTDDLYEVLLITEAEITERNGDGIPSYVYDTLRNVLTGKYTIRQIESLRPWNLLPKSKRHLFTKEWNKALIQLNNLGIKDSAQTQRLMERLLNYSPYLDGKSALSFNNIIKTLKSIKDIFEDNFPGYVKSGGLKLLKKQL